MNSNRKMHYRAVSMELAAYLDGRYVEMHIVTDRGETIAVACPNDSIFAIQKHIEQIGRECPEIATWSDDYRIQSGKVPAKLEHEPTYRS